MFNLINLFFNNDCLIEFNKKKKKSENQKAKVKLHYDCFHDLKVY